MGKMLTGTTSMGGASVDGKRGSGKPSPSRDGKSSFGDGGGHSAMSRPFSPAAGSKVGVKAVKVEGSLTPDGNFDVTR